MSDAVTRARELLDKATPGPWEAATCHESEQETRSEYVRGALLEPDAPAHGLWMAWKPDSPLGVHLTAVTGDGPHGAADAELIAAAPTLLAELADEVERLRAKVAAFADIEEAHNASYRMLRDQSGMTELVAEVKRLRALTAVDDAMVERASVGASRRAVALGLPAIGYAEKRDVLRAALEAALGVGS